MVFDKQLADLRTFFNINTPDDWQLIRPEWILARPNVGEATLQHLRLYLANNGITLLNDGTPHQWQKLLGKSRFGGMRVAATDEAETCPFTVLIDKQEKNPFFFQGFRKDARNDNRPLIVPVEIVSLGDHHGDYTIKGHEDAVSIERKSREDAYGTFLGWAERRDRFVEELEYLAGLPCAAVVVECSLGVLLDTEPRGGRSKQQNAKALMRTVMGWEQDYRVPFVFCDQRRLAEIYAFRLMERHFRKVVEAAKAVAMDGEREREKRERRERIERVVAEL